MNCQPEREEVFKCLTDCPAYQTYEAFNKFVKCDGRKELYGLLRDINDKISIHRSSNMNSGEEITRRAIARYENDIRQYVEPRNDTWFWFFSWR